MKKKNNRIVVSAAAGTTAGEVIYEEITFPMASEDTVVGGSEPMEIRYLKEQIDKSIMDLKARWDAAKDNKELKEFIEDENIAITLGKEAILTLLSQKDCEGIRFYFCKNPWGRNSVAAVGVKVHREAEGKIPSGKEEAEDIGTVNGELSILTSELPQPILNFEVGPPYTFGQLVNKSDTRLEGFIGALVKKYNFF